MLIEDFEVNEKLIEQVRSNQWSPDQNPEDRENKNALAALEEVSVNQKIEPFAKFISSCIPSV